MGRQSIFKLTLATILFIFAFYALFYTSIYPNSDNISHIQTNSQIPKQAVRIYMYDLPRRFTYGVIDGYEIARGGKGIEDATTLKYPGNQHAAEWHLFLDLNNTKRSGSLVRMLARCPDIMGYLVIELAVPAKNLVAMNGSLGWRNHLHDLPRRVSGALRVSVMDSTNLVSRVGHERFWEVHLGLSLVAKRKFCLTNKNSKTTDVEGGKIRDLLFQLLEDENDVFIKHGSQSRESRRMATQGMHTSKFCLHPAGDTPSACRLFDAIVSLCVPVIISDYIELPFEDVIDYRKIAVFVDTDSALKPGYLTKLLRGVKKDRILEFQKELKKVKHYFEYDDPDGTVNEIWRQVSLKLPIINLMINREKRIVHRHLSKPDCSCICSNQTGIHSSLTR
ncbi:hypothetical protein E3N88_04872 [Mikania micrantha]|uniref:Exostosin GT47 domain-containing protein n=1 Tax=Mikania micrantha TaxID=192012 RepID=A0A5N6PVN7_9ASTR|nr:hypothetical protein E3N88_04872 [Mikania micrantha]